MSNYNLQYSYLCDTLKIFPTYMNFWAETMSDTDVYDAFINHFLQECQVVFISQIN